MAIEVISTIKPKNNGDFPIVEAEDVLVGDKRLDEKISEIENTISEQINGAMEGEY